jgi:hypothetical protein
MVIHNPSTIDLVASQNVVAATPSALQTITVADVDSSNLVVTLTSSGGVVSIGSSSGAFVSQSASGALTLSGSGAELTAALGTLSFTASGINGNSTIRVCVRDNGGLDNNGLDSACYTFTIIANITSNKERLAKSSLSIFPNPTENGQFFFSSSDDEKLLEIEILDLSGKRLEKRSLLSFNGNIKVKSKGVFLAKFKYSDGYIETRKLESK